MDDGELRVGDGAALRCDELSLASARVGEDEPFSAIDSLLRAGALRRDGRPEEALYQVREARTILTRYLPDGDATLMTMDETIAELRGETDAEDRA